MFPVVVRQFESRMTVATETKHDTRKSGGTYSKNGRNAKKPDEACPDHFDTVSPMKDTIHGICCLNESQAVRVTRGMKKA